MTTIEGIDPGVTRLVSKLRAMGWDTTDSGDGKTKIAAGDEEALDIPHVHITTLPGQLITLSRILLKDVQRMVRAGDWCDIDIQAVYSPVDGVATISLYGIDDDALLPEPRTR